MMEERVLQERKEREEQRAKDKKARRVGFGDNVDVREFEGCVNFLYNCVNLRDKFYTDMIEFENS